MTNVMGWTSRESDFVGMRNHDCGFRAPETDIPIMPMVPGFGRGGEEQRNVETPVPLWIEKAPVSEQENVLLAVAKQYISTKNGRQEVREFNWVKRH